MTVYDPNLEKCVIGALCINPKKLEEVAQFLKPEDFTSRACEALYADMIDKFINNEMIDVALLPQCLVTIAENPTQYIASCMMEAPTTNNVVLHAHVVHDAAKERRLRDEIFEIFESAEKEEIATSILERCKSFIEDDIGSSKTMYELMNEACDMLNEPMGLRIDTGFPRLDGILKGMWGGNLIIIGARPGTGKSMMGLDLAESAARHGHNVLFYSLEMLGDELSERLICRRSLIPLDHIIDRTMDDDEIVRYTQACAELSTLPIFYEDKPNVTVQQIRAKARTIPDVELIIVDYIGLLKASRKYDSRNLELGAISRELKNLASELRIPIIALAQLNRGRQDDEEPNLSDLRDSGELEQNASKVIFLWNVDRDEGIKGCKVAKNRRGKTGCVQMNFQGEFMRFIERTEDVEYNRKGKSRAGYDDL